MGITEHTLPWANPVAQPTAVQITAEFNQSFHYAHMHIQNFKTPGIIFLEA